MKKFYLLWPPEQIFQTLSEKLPFKEAVRQKGQILQTLSKKSQPSVAVLQAIACCFPLPWSVYVRLLSVKNEHARKFYEAESLRGEWSVRQIDRQIDNLSAGKK